MNRFSVLALTAALAMAGSLALAQPGPGPGPMAAGPGASSPGMGMGMGPRHGHGGARWGADHTPGWSMMTPQERDAHREQMRGMKRYEDCQAFQAQHHEQMMARAKERGAKLPAAPRRDACAGLKP